MKYLPKEVYLNDGKIPANKEIAIGFAKWILINCDINYGGIEDSNNYYTHHIKGYCTTEQLYTLYLETL